MSKRQAFIVIGLWVMAFLFLGFPSSWHKAFAVATGIVILVMAYGLRSPSRKSPPGDATYIEHRSEPQAKPSSAPAQDAGIISKDPTINP